ncbi:hypothetical protein DM02DRAFT_623233 [Periconia macrospinosa]|uniref:Zn(2)-C6 fungal-type domain-containing protein n=1 Tax=Periconia macrospinosa TaxID=97972 RepID=A0A2V1E9J6_9PLEO|nr:hypothetical protein DM02DRAFT_623233 [Periconia macrospinosa]
MDDVDDDLDLKYHRGLNPEVYYRCPSSESLDGALRNELAKNAASLIPTDIVTEFVFGVSSTITISVARQPDLDLLFEPAEYPQSIAVEYALCRSSNGKERLKLQRAVARCLIEAIEVIDGFKYVERSAFNKEGSAGCRFRCSSQNKRGRKRKQEDSEEEGHDGKSSTPPAKYDCGGAIHIAFSEKREAINIVYKHNPIHSSSEDDQDSSLPALQSSTGNALQDASGSSSNKTKKPKIKRTRNKKDQFEGDSELDGFTTDPSAALAAPAAPTKKKRKKEANSTTTTKKSAGKSTKKGKQSSSPSTTRRKRQAREPTPPPPAPVLKGKCLRCKEKGIKCNEAKPTCNQCLRGLWTCQYEVPGPKKRSRNGCINCKSRRRKCTEERPSCAYCLRIDEDCEYQNDA